MTELPTIPHHQRDEQQRANYVDGLVYDVLTEVPVGQVPPAELARVRRENGAAAITGAGGAGAGTKERSPAAPFPPPDDEPPQDEQSAVDRRHLELRGRLLTAEGLHKIPAPVPIVDGLLYRDSLAWLSGKPGHGKSFTAVDLACCVGTGRSWHGREVTRGKVLYLIAEGATGLGQRVAAWSLGNGARVANVLFLPVPVQLLDDIDAGAFLALFNELIPDLAILDTQARVTVGAEENSSRDMGRFVDVLERVRRASSACLLTVHHDARAGENLRGSTALEGAATTILRAVKDNQLITITNAKQKDGPEQPPLTLALTPLGGSAILSHDLVGIGALTRSSEDRILTVLRDSFGTRGATKTELKEATDLPKTTYYRSVNELVSRGLLHERKEGASTVYTLPADDRQGPIPTSPTQSHE